MANWQDDTTSSPVYALMREMADDEAPHLNGLPESHPDVQALRARCMEALKSGRRAAGAAKGAETRQARDASTTGGTRSKLTDGSARQTRWATDIRATKIQSSLCYMDGGWKRVMDPRMEALVAARTTAKFWIDTRDLPWEQMVAKYGKRA